MRRLTSTFTGLLLLSAVGGNAWGTAQYALTDLGEFTGGDHTSDANGINNLGQVVGYSASRAFVWSPQTGMQMLGGLPGGTVSSGAMGINDLGQIVGYVKVGTANAHAYLWNDISNSQDLSASGNLGVESSANGINDAGQIVGYRFDTLKYRAVLMSASGTVQPLGVLGNYNSCSSRAKAINSKGQAVGYSDVATNVDHAFSWTSTQGILDLGGAALPSTADFYALDVNNDGLIAGYTIATNGTYSACLWTSPGSIQYLGALPNGMPAREALSLNAHGVVVGWANQGGLGHALVWSQTTGSLDLNDLLDASGGGWRLTSATAINDAGQIAGVGYNPQFYQHAYLLTPIPEPSTLALLGVGAIGLLACGWRRRQRR